MTVYLLHFHCPYYHARHYLGTTHAVGRRLYQHFTGKGSPLVDAVVRAGIPITLVRTWEGGREEERRLKRAKNTSRFCPLCLMSRVLKGAEAAPESESKRA